MEDIEAEVAKIQNEYEAQEIDEVVNEAEVTKIQNEYETEEIDLDDILIHSKTLDEHFDHVGIVLKRLDNANLKLNFKKCFWFRKELKFLGHIIANGVIKTDNEKIKIIEKWQTPVNVIQVLQFLGLAGYYRKFVKNFANIAPESIHV